jgi:hypothetical protein
MMRDRAFDGAVLLAGALFAWAAFLTPAVQAHHPHPSPLHIGTIHSADHTQHEEYCVWVTDGSMSHSTALTRINNTLYNDNPSQDFDGLSGNRIYFSPFGDPCPNYSSEIRQQIETEYQIKSGGFSQCGGTACVGLDSPYWNGAVGHNDYRWAYAYFPTSRINGGSATYHHVIGHETGHVLGLKDPDYSGHCLGNVSIMHSRSRVQP